MRSTLLFIPLILIVWSCNTPSEKQPQNIGKTMFITEDFDLQGHRGARGLYPENTIQGFLIAMDYGVTTLELDLVVSGDSNLVLSHEPWMSASICSGPSGSNIATRDQKQFNLFKMDYDSIKMFDCGSKGNPRFPEQVKAVAEKPLLADVVKAVDDKAAGLGLPLPGFNIEAKSREEWYGDYQPYPTAYVDLLLAEVRTLGIEERTVLQSFDFNILREIRQKDSNIDVSMLVEKQGELTDFIEMLGFVPEIYSPNYRMVDAGVVRLADSLGIKVIPWTINNPKDMLKMIQSEVDGIITDYPDRARLVLDSLQRQ